MAAASEGDGRPVREQDPAREGGQIGVEGRSNAGRHERVVEGKGRSARKCCLVAI